MAEMSFHDIGDEGREKILRGEFTVCDPCVGSGVMPLAFRGVVAREMGRFAASKLRISGADIDRVCVAMAGVQVLLTDDIYAAVLLRGMVGGDDGA